MKYAALNLLGVLTGLTLGWIAVATPLAAVFAPARVTWDATGCPAGTYTVISTAQKLGGGETFSATTTGVQLPRSTFSQEFSNLPNGGYSVSAIVQGNNGAVFAAKPQVIQASPDGTLAFGQRGPATTAPSARGVVRPRGSSFQSTSLASSLGAGGPASTPRSQPVIVAPAAGWQERSLLEIRRLLVEAGELDWRRIEVLDTDGDGVIDRAAIELAAGDIYILMMRGR
jgi:hypothetical protein